MTIDNECVAYGDDFNHFSEKNTIIVHCPLYIVHSARQREKLEFGVGRKILDRWGVGAYNMVKPQRKSE